MPGYFTRTQILQLAVQGHPEEEGPECSTDNWHD